MAAIGTLVGQWPGLVVEAQERSTVDRGNSRSSTVLNHLKRGDHAQKTAALNDLFQLSTDSNVLGRMEDTETIGLLNVLLTGALEHGDIRTNELDLEKVVLVLSNLSKHEKFHNAFVNVGVARNLCEVLGKLCGWQGSPSDRKGLASWFQFQSKEETKTSPEQLSQKRIDSTVVTRHVVQCISNLAKNTSNHDSIAKTEILDPLSMIVRESEDSQTRQLSLLSLAALAKHPQLGSSADLIKLFVDRLADRDPTIQWYSAGALRNAFRHVSSLRFVWRYDCVPALGRILSQSDNNRARLQAVLVIGELVLNDTKHGNRLRSVLVEQKTFALLATILAESKESDLQARVLRLLGQVLGEVNLCGEKTSVAVREQLAEAKFAETTLSLIRATSNLTGEALRSCVSSLKMDSPLTRSYMHAGLDKTVLALLRTGDKVSSSLALEVLVALSDKADWHEQLHRNGSLSALISAQTSRITGAPSTAVKGLANFARHDVYRTEIAYEGGLDLVFRLSKASQDSETTRQCARAIYNLCLGGLSRVMVVQSGAIDLIVDFMNSKDDETRLCGVGAVAALADNIEFAIQVVKSGAIQPLVAASNEKGVLGRLSLLALAEISNLQESHGLLASSGAIKSLLAAAVSPGGRGGNDIEVQQYATLALCNVATSDAARKELHAVGAPSKLSTLARSALAPPEIANIANATMANLVRGEQLLTQIVPFTPLTPL
eukprot:Plantae.Rhodophyta-Rhodochaete_pulchella.ctg9825.p1 GENE.Plantae.Rhodophyta-Rhodochaete_pulchella.ctg9825~~Plantae.Rhodophyta-Rhodochaete_pulchella.ctg9825.p1  ORF type:complete len:718 (+),score=110.25 Plantae.Rhodophyta-Rhodochaete_pulchella.ctg9825:174-2327(+)